MRDTSARMLALLGLLQSRADWSGAELADRLGVTDRTVRNDVTRLRGLGYPVDALRGPGGRYRLGVGAKMPPLLLDEDEAAAVVVGLRAATGMAGFEESRRAGAHQAGAGAARPAASPAEGAPRGDERRPCQHRLQRRGPGGRGGAAERAGRGDPRPPRGPRCDYRDEPCEIEPYHVVAWQRRWYLVGRDRATGDWVPYRVDWLRLRTPGGRRFAPQPFRGT